MINIALQTQPGRAPNASVAESNTESATASTPAAPADGGIDTIVPAHVALAALAYSRYANHGRTIPANAETLADVDEAALARRFGPAVTRVRAALPTALQSQFTAQLLSAGEQSPEADSQLAAAELGRLIAGGESDARASVLVSRLAQSVAHFGSFAVAQALGITHDRLAFAADLGAVAGPPDDPYPARRQRERSRGESRRDEQPRSDATPPDEDPGFTIDDIVSDGGQMVAHHRMASPGPLTNGDPRFG